MIMVKKFITVIIIVLKSIVLSPLYVFRFFLKGFNTLSLFLSRGFYFYLEKLVALFHKVFKFGFLNSIVNYFKEKQEQPTHIVMIIIWILSFIYLFDTLHIDNNNNVQHVFNEMMVIGNEPYISQKNSTKANVLLNKERNLYKIYSKYSLDDISFQELKEKNNDTVAWITVEDTNINYPIVQSSDNDYYLNHSFDKSYSTSGWTFLDYRNSSDMNDKNTIIYGHNLLNKTALGSIDKIFKTKKEDLKVIVMTENGLVYKYQIFSAYIIEPEVYYLRTRFASNEEYAKFLNTIKERNESNVFAEISPDDKILTLSTCTEDNKNRKVVHAKLLLD